MTDTFGISAKTLHKKLFGTTALVVAMIAALIISTGQVNALFTFINGHIQMTGTVLQVHGSSFDVDTGGSHPFQVIVDDSTDYEEGFASLDDLEVGDSIRLMAREDQGNILAQSVSPLVGGGYGYGSGCEELNLNNVYVSAIEADRMVLSRANITFDVGYGDFTDIIGGSLEDIQVNDVITVVGSDCGDDGFEAARVILFNDAPIALCDSRSEQAFVVYNDVHLLSHDEGGAFSPVIDVDIPAGKYDVYGVSYDQHDINTWDTSVLEEWYVTGWSEGTQDYQSDATTDLPDNQNRNISQIGSAIMTDGFDQLQLVHAAFPEANYNSVLPECVIFEPVADDTTNDQMVLSCEVNPANALVVYNDQVLLSHDEGGAFTPEFPVSIPDGTYDVYGVSYDHHSQNPWDTFDGEQWSFTAYTQGTTAYISDVTDDLPDNVDRNVSMIGESVAMSGVDGISYSHASYPDPNYLSVLPECVVLVPTDTVFTIDL